MMPDLRFEAVHFVEGYIDGVLNGTADYNGAPHHFELRSAEPNAAEIYLLTPLSPAAFNAVKEAWQIWRRWESAQLAAQDEPTQALPALPEDRERQAELRAFIAHSLELSRSAAFLAEGDFEHVLPNVDLGVERALLQVKWSRLETR